MADDEALSPETFAASVKAAAGAKPKGTLVLSVTDGSVVKGTGDLEGASGAKVGGVIYAMLQDAAGVLEEDEGLRKLSVVFGAFEFAVTLDDAHVYVVKKATS